MSKYSELLKDPRWQKKRLEILKRDDWACQVCFDTESTLNVHHRFYENNINPWEYSNKMLVTLCDDCHKQEHNLIPISIETLKKAILQSGYTSGDIIEIAGGFIKHKKPHVHDVSASVIAFVLSDIEIMENLSDIYFKRLGEKKTSIEEVVERQK